MSNIDINTEIYDCDCVENLCNNIDNNDCYSSPLTFNWSANSNDGSILDTRWNEGGSPKFMSGEQSYHIFTANNTDIVTVEALFAVQNATGSTVLFIDEISPNEFNDANVTNPMNLTIVSSIGSTNITVTQSGTNLSFNRISQGSQFEIIKVTFTVQPAETCSIWNYRIDESSNSPQLFIVNAKIILSE